MVWSTWNTLLWVLLRVFKKSKFQVDLNFLFNKVHKIVPNSEKKYQLLAKCARKFCHLSCTVFVDLFQLHNHILFGNSCFITTIWQAASNTFSLQLLIYDTPNGNSQWWTVACRQTFLTVFGNMLIYVTFDYHNIPQGCETVMPAWK